MRGSDGMGMNLGLDRRIVLYVLDSQRVPWGMVLGNGDPIGPTKSAATTAQKSELNVCMDMKVQNFDSIHLNCKHHKPTLPGT